MTITPETPSQKKPGRGYLDGQMLIAMPAMDDERFARCVIYVCAHSSEGAMGIVVNQPAAQHQLSRSAGAARRHPGDRPHRAAAARRRREGAQGRAGRDRRGFVLHSSDFFIENSTLPIDDGICLTATLDILKAIARGAGPDSAVLALGYAGWAPGQLETEIQDNGWLHCAGRSGTDLRHRHRQQIRPGAAQDRHRSRHAVERGRPRLDVHVLTNGTDASLNCA